MRKCVIFSSNEVLAKELKRCLGKAASVSHEFSTQIPAEIALNGIIAFVDQALKNWRGLCSELRGQGAFIVLIVEEKGASSLWDSESGWKEKDFDDVVVHPFRHLELLSLLKHSDDLLHARDLEGYNDQVKNILVKMEEDLRIARALQGRLIPEKFDPIPGIRVNHKYLSGLKSGGDYLDFFEFEDGAHVGILMSDSSGYGLSSAFMTVILRTAFKFSRGEAVSPALTVRRIYSDLKFLMKSHEDLSLFYGIMNRKTLEFHFVSVGNVRFFMNSNLENEMTNPLKRDQQFQGKDQSLQLKPGDRMVFMTDGFYSSFDSPDSLQKSLKKNERMPALDFVNACNFEVKKRIKNEKEDMPPQDCAVLVIDLERTMIRLAKG